jgi:hypothetical protein
MDRELAQSEIDISYLQVAVFQAGLEAPYNEWQQVHTDQGFSWRPESVSFRALEDGKATTNVKIVEELSLRPEALRAIMVPFTVPPSGLIEIGSVIETQTTEIEPGSYNLVYQTGFDEQGRMWCEFDFSEAREPTFAILRADEELKIPVELLLSATAAN